MKLSIVQAFIVAKVFLGKVFFDEEYSDELNILHAEFIINKCKNNWEQEPETWDPSVWINWIKAAKKILLLDEMDEKTVLVTQLQAYRIMKRYIHNFAYKYNFLDLINLFKKLDIDKEQNFKVSVVWKDWLLSVNALLENKLTDNDSLISIHEKVVSKSQSFYMMNHFLKFYSSKKLNNLKNKEILYVLKKLQQRNNYIDNSLYQDWLTIYKKVCAYNDKSSVSVMQSFNIMRLFLEEIVKKNVLRYDLKDFIYNLKVDDEQMPVGCIVWHDWLHVAYKVLLPC